MQKFWKSVKIWQSFGEFTGGPFFETQCRFFRLLFCRRHYSCSRDLNLVWTCLLSFCLVRVCLKLWACFSAVYYWKTHVYCDRLLTWAVGRKRSSSELMLLEAAGFVWCYSLIVMHVDIEWIGYCVLWVENCLLQVELPPSDLSATGLLNKSLQLLQEILSSQDSSSVTPEERKQTVAQVKTECRFCEDDLSVVGYIDAYFCKDL